MDAIEAAGEAIRDTREWRAAAAFGVPEDAVGQCVCALARAAVAALAAQGDITDEEIVDAVTPQPHMGSATKVRALLARQAAIHATQVAELEALADARAAEIEVLRQKVNKIKGPGKTASLRKVRKERDRYKARLDAVKAIHYPVVCVLSASSDVMHAPMKATRCACSPNSVVPCRTLAALADPKEKDA